MKVINLIGIVLVALALMQCGSQGNSEDEHQSQGAHDEHAGEEQEDIVALTRVQMANAGIATQVGFDSLNISGYIRANGNFDLPPENVAAITAPMQGTVKEANYLVGSHVSKGAVLAVLEHPDYIKLQEEYLHATNNLDLLQAEYHRQKTLDSANVTARKAFQQAETSYRSAMTRKLSLEKQLQYIGINPVNVVAGKLSAAIAIRAPFSGYITKLNVHKGEFVSPEQELYELINTDHMHLELNVYEADIFQVAKGQPIEFSIPSLGTQTFPGEVYLVGKSFDKVSKTVKVHGHVENMAPQFIRGLYVEATIFTGNEQVSALPEQAVIRDAGKTFIFIRQEQDQDHGHEDEHPDASHDHDTGENHDHGGEQHEETTAFRRLQVVTGIRRNGMVEIRSAEAVPENAAIVVHGAYDLYAEMKKGEGGHHHH